MGICTIVVGSSSSSSSSKSGSGFDGAFSGPGFGLIEVPLGATRSG